MRRSDCVVPGGLQQLDLTLFCAVECSGSKRSIVVVNAPARQLDGFAVQEQPLFGRPRQCANSECGHHLINDIAVLAEPCHGPVQRRRLGRPQRRFRDGDVLGRFHVAARACADSRSRTADYFFIPVDQLGFDGQTGFCGRFVRHSSAHGEPAGFTRSLRRGDRDSPMRDVNRLGDEHSHVPVDPRPGVPAAVRLGGVINAHGQHVRSREVEVRREVETKAGVSVRLIAQLVPVQIYRRVAVHTVELNADSLALPFGTRTERFAIPAGACREIAAFGTCRVRFVDASLDAPVVGKVYGAPFRIVERARLGAARISGEESPVRVRLQLQTGPLRLRGCGKCQKQRHSAEGEWATGSQFHEGLFFLGCDRFGFSVA